MVGCCKNHPDRAAKRRCYTCHEFICSECQIVASHHIFCSKKCHSKFVFTSIFTKFASIFTSLFILLKNKIKSVKISPIRLVIDIALISAILFCIYLLRGMILELALIKSAKPVLVQIEKPGDSRDLTDSTLTHFSLKNKPQAMVLQNNVNITGESDGNVILSLSVNGILTDVTLAKNGKFLFENVPLTRGSNKIAIRAISEDGTTTILEELETTFGTPTFKYLARDISRGNRKENKIALTFDGGANDKAADEILDFLAQKHIKCTMFLTGAFIQRNKELVKRMSNEGHEIGNHTWSHPHLTSFEINRRHNTLPEVNRSFVQSELLRTAQLFEQVTGKKMAPLWRAPYGEHNLQIRQWAAEVGFQHVSWSIDYGNGETMDTQDWVADTTASNYHSSQEILENFLNFGQSNNHNANGCIALMHLGTNRTTDPAHKILPALIDSLRARGYELVKASELIQ